MAIVHKTRLSGTKVKAHRIIGDVQHASPLLVDDMLSTGGTIEAAVQALLAAGCAPAVTVVTSHALWVGPAAARWQGLPIRQVCATDSVTQPQVLPCPLQVVNLETLLATAISRLHCHASLGELLVHR